MVLKSPTVRHRRLGRELRKLREETGLLPETAAKQLGWSRQKLNRLENARTMPSTTDVAAICDLYGTDSTTKAGLVQLCKDAGQRGWWTAYSDVLAGSYVVLEAEATAIRTWEPLLIPGLLQSEGYARAIIQDVRPALEKDDLERRVTARMTRKITLLGASAPTFHALIDEGAIRRQADPAELMAAQLDELLQIMNRPNVTIQVMPAVAGLHLGMQGSFSVLSFDPEDPSVGYTGSPGGDLFLEAAASVNRLMLTFERLTAMALSPEQSADLIAAVRSDYD
ncbi:helix-turn-helix transcriptional regulator [Streptosporangium sp. NPDC000239]|uniref:helix-turn-helix domain-containing protein n=1 Tax=Streptosporangium sp. NPDC000239 TaxID=3154248 RepID=UPI00332B35AE